MNLRNTRHLSEENCNIGDSMKWKIEGTKAHLIDYTQGEIAYLKSKLVWVDYMSKTNTLLFFTAGKPWTLAHVPELLKKYDDLGIDIEIDGEKPLPPLKVDVDPKCMKGVTMYDHQVRVVKDIFQKRKGIVHATTGSGKSLAILAIFKYIKPDQKMVVIVPSITLADQIYKSAIKFGISKSDAGIIDGTRKQKNKRLTFIVGDSADLAIKRKTDTAKLLINADVLVFDECHGLKSPSWSRIWSISKAGIKVGFSGTPFSSKDRYLDDYGDTIIYGLTGGTISVVNEKDTIKAGVNAKTFVHFISLPGLSPYYPANMTNLHKDKIVNNDTRNKIIVESAIRSSKMGLKTLILIQRHEHCKKLVLELGRKGVRALGKIGGTSCFIYDDYTDDVIEDNIDSSWVDRFEEGEWDVLVGSRSISTGTDVPNINFLIFAAAGKSRASTLQARGRGTRSKKYGHQILLLMDFTDRSHRFLASQSRKRRELYEESHSVIMEDKYKFWALATKQSEQIKKDKEIEQDNK